MVSGLWTLVMFTAGTLWCRCLFLIRVNLSHILIGQNMAGNVALLFFWDDLVLSLCVESQHFKIWFQVTDFYHNWNAMGGHICAQCIQFDFKKTPLRTASILKIKKKRKPVWEILTLSKLWEKSYKNTNFSLSHNHCKQSFWSESKQFSELV